MRTLRPLVGSRLARLAPGPWKAIFWKLASGAELYLIHDSRMFLPEDFRYRKYILGAYEPGTTQLLMREVRPGMVVCDVGAQIGYFTLLCARLAGPQGRVIAFEPEPGNAAVLRRNVALNDYRHVLVVQKGVSDRAGSAVLFSSSQPGCHSLYPAPEASDGREIAVETVALGEFLPAAGIHRVDLLKIDVEGAEMRVLEGMQTLLASRPRPKLILEYNPERLAAAGHSQQDFFGLLARYGFRRISLITDQGPPALLCQTTAPITGSVNLFCEGD